jgi:hypothetical protein
LSRVFLIIGTHGRLLRCLLVVVVLLLLLRRIFLIVIRPTIFHIISFFSFVLLVVVGLITFGPCKLRVNRQGLI